MSTLASLWIMFVTAFLLYMVGYALLAVVATVVTDDTPRQTIQEKRIARRLAKSKRN